MKNLFFIHLILLIVISYSFSTDKRVITSEDFYQIREILDCQVSPDGQMIAYVVQRVDYENNRYISNIWLISANGGEPKQLTMCKARDQNPVWSPDSRYISFVSDRNGKKQIWLIPVSGGEAWTLTDMPSGAHSPAWSPDANHIAFLSNVNDLSEDHVATADQRTITTDGKEYATDIKIIKNLKYRSGTSYFDGRFSHIFTIPVNGGKAEQLTFGNYHDSALAWSSDSKWIAFSSNRNGDQYFDDNSDIFMVSTGNKKVKQLTASPGPEYKPVWSPDGNYICFTGKSMKNDYALKKDIYLLNLKSNNLKTLTQSFKESPFNIQWDQNGENIYFLVAERGNIALYSLSRDDLKINKIIGGNRQVKTYQITRNKKIIFKSSENTNPGDLFICDRNGKHEKRLTKINEYFLSKILLTDPQEISFAGYENTLIQGWLMKPVHFSPEKKYPLILEIHGGPHWNFGNSWFQEFQLLAAQGYVVFYCNPRLSTGYGQEFAQSGVGSWGVGDYEDLMKGVNFVLNNFAFIDSTRMGVTGGSYGGYMTNWIISHTNRFKAAVTQRSLSNLFSFYGTTDIQSFIEYELVPPWENYDKLMQHSPISFAHKIRTPLLIIHSELDYRVPISQAEELFNLVKRFNVDVEFIRYPNEGHDLSRNGQPIHRVDRYNRIVDWFNKHLK